MDCLLDSALEPVLDEAAKKPDPEKAILDLKVCDPACGSGHFLVAAARRMALRLATVRSGGEEPSPPAVQRALRDVVGRCIYGVDLNPMAVELCKVSLWMEAIEPGKPLSFLEGHIQQGNALLGATPALMAKGIPDEAFEPIEGDDKEVAKRLKKRNKKARETGQLGMEGLFTRSAPESTYVRLTSAAMHVEEDKDDDIGAVRKKEEDWEQLTASADFKKAMFLADAWCAAFVWPKQKGVLEDGAITEDLWRRMEKDLSVVPSATRREVSKIAREYSFFHWHLAFPQVFFAGNKADEPEDKTTVWSGGFDIVLGNPPWEKVKLVEKEFFAERAPAVVRESTTAARENAIKKLKTEHPDLALAFEEARRVAEGTSHLLRRTGQFPLCARGDVNTYAVFAEHNRNLMSAGGRAGFIVPSGIATDDTTKAFFDEVMQTASLDTFYSFWETRRFFPGTDSRNPFALVTLRHAAAGTPAMCGFDLRAVEEVIATDRTFYLNYTDVTLLNPNTHTCPVFRSRRDAEITKSIYRRVPVIIREARDGSSEENPWGVRLSTMFHMSNDSRLFRTRVDLERDGWALKGNAFHRGDERMSPLYEGRLGHQFNHRYAQEPGGELQEVRAEQLKDPMFSVEPQFWVPEAEAVAALSRRTVKCRTALLGFRRVTRAGDERTVIASILPWSPASYGFILTSGPAPRDLLLLLAGYNSFPFDYLARSSLSQPSFPQSTFEQLAFPPPAALSRPAPGLGSSADNFLLPRSLELTYTAWDLEPFAKDCGYDGPPYRWDEARRFLLRCELDAAFFHLYAIARDDVDYIMGTFPIVKRKDIAAHGTYRTKDTILDIYDRMQRAIDTGEPYQTLLDPPPADPRVAHPPRPSAQDATAR